MKKLLYPFAFLLMKTAIAQEVPGYHPQDGYAYEDFGKKNGYPQLTWTSQEPLLVRIDSLDWNTLECLHEYRYFSYSMERNVDQHKGLVKINQPYSEYNGFGITFGKNEKGKPKVLDLSQGNAVLSFIVKNKSDYQVNIFVRLIDSEGKIADAVGPNQNMDAWKDMTEVQRIAPEQELQVSFDYNEQAFHVLYNDSSMGCGPFNYNGVDLSFDKSKVAGVEFAVVNSELAEIDSYKSYPLIGAALEFSEIKIGRKVGTGLAAPVVTDLEKDEDKGFEIYVYPNPTKETLHFSKQLQEVVLSDMGGNTVCQVESAKQLDLRKCSKGIYVLKSASLRQPIKVVIE